MTSTPASKVLTENLLGIVRQQRHYGVRVIVSTQEPTINPKLIDLCSTTIIHRFTSPEWFSTLRRHISMEEEGEDDTFKRILDLHTGEALLFAPSALLPDGDDVRKLGMELLKIKVRKRLTWDGGKSILAV